MSELEIRDSPIDYKVSVIYRKIAFTIDKDTAELVGEEKLEEIAKLFFEVIQEERAAAATEFAEQVIENLEIQDRGLVGKPLIHRTRTEKHA